MGVNLNIRKQYCLTYCYGIKDRFSHIFACFQQVQKIAGTVQSKRENGRFCGFFQSVTGYLFLSLGDGGDSIEVIPKWIRNVHVAQSLRLNDPDIHLRAGREDI